jgi:hypothetical protein
VKPSLVITLNTKNLQQSFEARRLNIPESVWNKMPEAEPWAAAAWLGGLIYDAGAWAWAWAWAGLGAWNVWQRLGALGQNIKNFFGGEGVAAEAEAAAQTASRLTEYEQATMSRLMDQTGLELRESPHVGAEYIDQFGRTYDQMGTPLASQFWNESQFLRSIDWHLLKSNNFTAIDLTGFTAEQIAVVRNYIGGLAPELQAKIMRIGC